jgi:nitrilase
MGDEYPTVKLAAVQAAPVFLNREASVDKACRLILEAGRNRADVVGFPESFISGFPHWFHFFKTEDAESKHFYKELFKNAVVIPSQATDALCGAAREAGSYVVIGLNEKAEGSMGTIYNTQLFISNKGEILGKHRKIVPTVYERLVYGGGDGSTLRVVDTEYGPLGGLICGEHTNSLARFALIAKGERIHVASWAAFAAESERFIHETIDFRVRNHAFEGKNFVISVTGIFSKEMKEILCRSAKAKASIVNDGGHSSIVGPFGEFLAGPAIGETILYAEADLERIIEAKQLHDVLGHYNRFDILRLTVNEECLTPVRRAEN